jgi:ABC-type transport system involved in multi-copper enzyme maturation permease subunit
MGNYLAIIFDSYREARDTKILTILILLSSVIILLVAGIGWWKVDPYTVELGGKNGKPWLGLTVNDEGGLLELTGVDSLGPSNEIELGPDCVLVTVDSQSISTKDQLRTMLETKTIGDKVELTIRKPWLSYFLWDIDTSSPIVGIFVSLPTEAKITGLQFYIFNKFVVGFAGIIAALLVTAGFMPRFLDTGAIHLVMSRPVSRFGVIWAKFLGGLSFIVVLSVFLIGGVFLVISLRSGIWNTRALYAIPMLIFTFAQFYAFSCLCSVLTRSQIFTIIAVLLFYLLTLLFNFLNNTTQEWLAGFSPNAIALTPDGRRLSLSEPGEKNSRIEQYVLHTQKPVGVYPNIWRFARAGGFAVNQTGQQIYTSTVNNSIVALDQFSRKKVREHPFEIGRIRHFAIAPDDHSVVISSARDLAVFSLNENRRLPWPELTKSSFRSVTGRTIMTDDDTLVSALAYNGRLVVTAYESGKIKIRQALNGHVEFEFAQAHKKPVCALFFFKEQLVSAGQDGRIHLWDLETKKKLHTFTCSERITDLAINEQTGRLAVIGQKAAIQILRIQGNHIEPEKALRGLHGKTRCASFSSDGKLLAAAGGTGLSIVWDVSRNKEVGRIDVSPGARKFATVLNVLYWFFPRTTELDHISYDLLKVEDQKESKMRAAGREVEYLSPILSGCLFIFTVMSMGAGVFSLRDL